MEHYNLEVLEIFVSGKFISSFYNGELRFKDVSVSETKLVMWCRHFEIGFCCCCVFFF